MPTFMTQFSYTGDTLAVLAKSPEDRSAPLARLMEALGGRLIAFYYAFGEYDGLAIYEAPDASTALTGVVTVGLASHLKATKTTQLFTVAEAMAAMGKSGQIVFKAPGG
jgi:uncharacterized protein with GYD domain